MLVVQLIPPAMEPVSHQDVKSYLRLSDDEDVGLIDALIAAARSHVEAVTGTVLIEQSFRQYFDEAPNGPVVLGRYPVSSVTKLVSYDVHGEATEHDQALQNFRGDCRPPKVDISLPGDASNGAELEFIAGYGPTSVDVPPQLRQAILELVAHWYEFRGAIAPHQQAVSLPVGFEMLIAPFRQVRL